MNTDANNSKESEVDVQSEQAMQQHVQYSEHSNNWAHVRPPMRQPRFITLPEKLLLPVALVVAILFDRMIIAMFFQSSILITASLFYVFYIVAFYAFYWKKAKNNAVAWLIAGFVVALAVWNVAYYGSNLPFAIITFFAMPAIVMLHTQWVAGGYSLKDHEGIGIAWILGWIIKPFASIGVLFDAVGSLFKSPGKPVFWRVLIGASIALGLLIIIVPLLMAADQMFHYHVTELFRNINISLILFHAFAIAIAFGLFYSVLREAGFGKKDVYKFSTSWTVDSLISNVVLASVILVYVLFVAVLFTHLFAQAGLPAGMTYAQYARTGFFQTLLISFFNLAILGFFLRFGAKKERGISLTHVLLAVLLALTVIMLISGGLRLTLYINAYGMTWLRLLSLWFLLYISIVAILCALRLSIMPKLPVVAAALIFLLFWYIALGFVNPEGFIAWFNRLA